MLPILALAAFAVFLWSVIGLINPKWGRISNRWVSIPIWFVSFILLLIVGAIGTDDTTERSVAPTKAHAVPVRSKYSCGFPDGRNVEACQAVHGSAPCARTEVTDCWLGTAADSPCLDDSSRGDGRRANC